jgi:hypothetical protein
MKRLPKGLHLDPPGKAPTEEQIEEVISGIEKRLAMKAMNRTVNQKVKDGYTMAVDILRRRQMDYSGIETLSSDQARAIAGIAVDFLNGKFHGFVLLSIPFKKM